MARAPKIAGKPFELELVRRFAFEKVIPAVLARDYGVHKATLHDYLHSDAFKLALTRLEVSSKKRLKQIQANQTETIPNPNSEIDYTEEYDHETEGEISKYDLRNESFKIRRSLTKDIDTVILVDPDAGVKRSLAAIRTMEFERGIDKEDGTSQSQGDPKEQKRLSDTLLMIFGHTETVPEYEIFEPKASEPNSEGQLTKPDAPLNE